VHVAVHPLQHRSRLRIELFSPFVAQDIEVAVQHLQRRAQFVREVGQRLRPHPFGPLSDPSLGFDRAIAFRSRIFGRSSICHERLLLALATRTAEAWRRSMGEFMLRKLADAKGVPNRETAWMREEESLFL
jgi:SOS response regulatory protein OraA/RecX